MGSVRQFVTLHILRPLAHSLGIKGGKVMRFLEREWTFARISQGADDTRGLRDLLLQHYV